MFHCPHCGGQLRYDIISGQMKCDRCDSSFSVAEAEKLNTATGENGMQGYTYTCPNCGGELFSVDTTATTFCSFCGSSVLLEQRLTEDICPDRIVPFKITRDQCVEKYREYIRRMFCVDRRMIKDAVVDSFRAIYVPYCNFKTQTHGELFGEASETKGNTEYVYRVHGKVDYDNDWQLRDLSIALPDDHSERINEFSRDDSVPFSPAYLAGFFADLPDVKPEVYSDDVMNANAVDVAKAFYEANNATASSAQMQKVAEQAKELTRQTGYEHVMLPVWFMSFRYQERVCYAMVNGVTGKVTADLPVDFRRFFLRAGLVSIAAFFLLAFFFNLVMKPNVTLAVASCILAMVCWLVRGQYKKLALREGEAERLKAANREVSKGNSIETKPKAKGRGIATGSLGLIAVIGFFAVRFMNVIPEILDDLSFLNGSEFLRIIGGVAMALTGAAVMIGPGHKRTTSILAFILTIGSFLLLILDLHQDLPIYLFSFLMLLCAGACEVDMIQSYNRQCSNAIPVFETHRGGDMNA